jgi:LacI family transcriptional regulator
MLNRRVRGVRAAVTVDDAAGAAVAVRHLAELGHTHIAGIFGPGAIDTTRRRREGFLAAGKQAGLRATAIDALGLDPAAGNAAAVEIFETHRRVTAIFASTFAIGMGVLRAARQTGVKIPEQISVIASTTATAPTISARCCPPSPSPSRRASRAPSISWSTSSTAARPIASSSRRHRR